MSGCASWPAAHALDPTAGAAAALGAEVRRRRLTRKLTLAALGGLVGYSPQHLSELERGRSVGTPASVGALDAVLGADGALLERLPAAVTERAFAAQARAAARGRYDADVEPTNRRGLLEAGAATALGAAALGDVPAGGREVDPELPAHWAALLALLDRHDSMFGPHDVLDTVRRELWVIAEHRCAARGELRAELMRVEARWTEFAAFLSNDAGQRRARTAYTDRALRLAEAAADPDTAALVRMRLAQWAVDERDGPAGGRAC